MKTFMIVGASALALAFAASAVTAQDADVVEQDVRCVALGLMMADSDDAETADAGLMATFYYYGRLEGRDPDVDWLTRVGSAAETMTQQDFEHSAQVCGDGMMRLGAAMESFAANQEG